MISTYVCGCQGRGLTIVPVPTFLIPILPSYWNSNMGVWNGNALYLFNAYSECATILQASKCLQRAARQVFTTQAETLAIIIACYWAAIPPLFDATCIYLSFPSLFVAVRSLKRSLLNRKLRRRPLIRLPSMLASTRQPNLQ